MLERICGANLACAAHGYADGAPILDLRTAEAELAAHLAEEGGVKLVEPKPAIRGLT